MGTKSWDNLFWLQFYIFLAEHVQYFSHVYKMWLLFLFQWNIWYFAFVRMNWVSVSAAGVRFTTRTFCNLFFLAWMPNPFSFPKHNSIKRKERIFSPLCCLLFLSIHENSHIFFIISVRWFFIQSIHIFCYTNLVVTNLLNTDDKYSVR